MASISTLYLLHDKEYFSRFRNWGIKGAKLVLRGNRLYLHVTFEEEIEEKTSRDDYGLDVNFREIVLVNHEEAMRFKVAFDGPVHYYHLVNRTLTSAK